MRTVKQTEVGQGPLLCVRGGARKVSVMRSHVNKDWEQQRSPPCSNLGENCLGSQRKSAGEERLECSRKCKEASVDGVKWGECEGGSEMVRLRKALQSTARALDYILRREHVSNYVWAISQSWGKNTNKAIGLGPHDAHRVIMINHNSYRDLCRKHSTNRVLLTKESLKCKIQSIHMRTSSVYWLRLLFTAVKFLCLITKHLP